MLENVIYRIRLYDASLTLDNRLCYLMYSSVIIIIAIYYLLPSVVYIIIWSIWTRTWILDLHIQILYI